MMPPAVTLSPEQDAVVAHRGSDLQVIACADSGRTESISRRVAAQIAEGAEPASVVAFTFTERAAVELKDRITRRLADRIGEAFRDRLGPTMPFCTSANKSQPPDNRSNAGAAPLDRLDIVGA